MKNIFIILSLIIVLPLNAMKKNRHEHRSDHCMYDTFDCLVLEVQKIIFDFCTINTVAKKPKIATQMVRNLSFTNKHFNALINEPQLSDNLIDIFTYKFKCSHETIAQYLSTKAAKDRLDTQLKLKNFIIQPFIAPKCVNCMLQQLSQEDLNFDFTYNYSSYWSSSPKTALMIILSTQYCTPREKIFDWLSRRTDINRATSHGLTLLHAAAEYPIKSLYLKKILAYPDLIINKQNKRGENALLYSLLKRTRSTINYTFVTLLSLLLKAGADPNLPNRNGVTAFSAIKELDDVLINATFLLAR